MSNDNEQPAWEYPVSASLQGDGECSREVRWRPWPCNACRKFATPFDFLRNRQKTSGKFPKGIWNRVVGFLQNRESRWLVEWTESCPHFSESVLSFPELAQGSEHRVYFDELSGTVTKVTLPGCFGDFNYLEDRRICQAQSTPLLYLNRMWTWRNIFGNAPHPIGVTLDGRIITKQTFIKGEHPTQAQVDEYLAKSGMIPLRQECFLWKSPKLPDLSEIWIGDTRDENFVMSNGTIVPIDIRLWWKEPKSPVKGGWYFGHPGAGRRNRSRR